LIDNADLLKVQSSLMHTVELYQRQAILKAEIKELAQRWSGYQLAGQLLMDLLTELSEQQLPSLLQYQPSSIDL
jgi:uncharacterized protein YhaN